MKTKINHAGRELGSKKLLSAIAVLAVVFVVFAAIPAVADDNDAAEATEVATFDALKSAVDTDNFNVKLTANVEITEYLSITKTGVLDLNGKTITRSADEWAEGATSNSTITVGVNGNLMINDSSADKAGAVIGSNTLPNAAALAVINGGACTINGGTFELAANAINAEGDIGGWYTVANEGSLTIKDGTFVGRQLTGDGSSMIKSGWYDGNAETKHGNDLAVHAGDSTATLTIDGGVFKFGLNTVKNDDYGVLVINGGTFSNTSQAVVMNNNVATINGGTFNASKQVIVPAKYNDTSNLGITNINGGNFNVETGYYIVEMNTAYDVTLGEVNVIAGTITGPVVGFKSGVTPVAGSYAGTVKIGNNAMTFSGILPGNEDIVIFEGSIVISGTLDASTAAAMIAAAGGNVVLKDLTITGGDAGSLTLTGDIAVEGTVTVASGANLTVASGVKLIVDKQSTIRVDGTITIEKGGEMENSGNLSLANEDSINFRQKGKPQDMGRFVHVKDSRIMVDGYKNAWDNLFFFVDSHYKFKEGFFYKVRMENFGPEENVYFGIRDITIQWNGKVIDEKRLKNAGAEVIPLVPKESLRVEAISYSPALEYEDDVINPGFYTNAVVSEVTLTYSGEDAQQPSPQTRTVIVNGDLEIIKADFSSELVTVTPGPNPTYTGNDLKDQFTFDVNYTIDGNEPITIPSTWYTPIFNVKDPNGGLQPVEEVVNAGEYWVQLEATPDNKIFQGMTNPIRVEVLKAITSITLEDTTNGEFWTAMAYRPGMIKITPNPPAASITATATIDGRDPFVQEIGANDNASAQDNLDAMLSNVILNNKAGMTYKIKVEIKETGNTTGSEAELQITVGEFEKLDDYLTIEAEKVSSKTDVTVEKDPENKFRYNASGPVERDPQTGDYIFYLKVTANDLALMNQPGENGCGVEFEGSDGVEISVESITQDGKYAKLKVTVKKLPMDGIITITATPNVGNLSLLLATYTVDLSGLYPAELRIVFHDEYNTVTFTENLIAYAYILDKLKDGDGNPSATAQELRDLLQFEIGDDFLLPAPSDGKQWKLSYIGSNDEPVDQYYAGNSIYVIKEEHIDATNAIHFWAANAPDAPQPETGNVVFVFGDEVEIRTMELGTLSIPDDIAEAATKPGFTYVWKYNGVEISGETQVVDGMILIAEYTEEPVTTGDVTFVYGTNAVTRPIEFGTLSVPEDVDTEAQMDGYTHIWTYMGTAISEETEVVDGMVVVAVYTAIPVEPTTGDVTFGFGGISITRAMEFGTFTVPADIDAAAKKDGYTHIWTYNGAQISEETQVVDGMIVIAEYTAIPVDPTTGKVIFVFGGVGVTKTLNLGTLEVPEDVNAAAQKEGYDLDWTYNGVKIDAETQVVDGMVVVAVYTLIHVEPTTGDVTFVYDGTAVVKTLDLGTLVVPQDVNDAAQKDGYDLAWMYDGNVISGQTQVKDGMIVVAVYTPIPVEPTTGDVTFVYDGTAVVKTLDLGTLVVPQDVNDAAQKDGYDLAWTYKGEKINAETQVEDGMVIVAVYTETPVPVEYSTNMIVALKVVDGKIFYTIVAVDGKAVPAGTLDISYAYEVDLGEYGTSVDFGLIKVEITNENGSEYVSGSVDLPEGALSAYAVFTYDGGSESTPVYNK